MAFGLWTFPNDGGGGTSGFVPPWQARLKNVFVQRVLPCHDLRKDGRKKACEKRVVVVEEPLQSLMVTHIIRKGHEKTRTMDRRCSFLFKPCQKAPSLVFLVLMTSVVLLLQAPQVTGLRCYVCGGSTGRECEEIVTRRWSPYVRPRPVLTSDGKRQWEECNDLINNKGCIKQVVDGGKCVFFGKDEFVRISFRLPLVTP